jgi:coniferyl-aldehyde dehydrogenase
LLASRIAQYFGADELAVVQGDASVGAAFSALPFDHLFFTGSTAVGRRVAQAAAHNLTPVTLELGGKSPAIFDRGADVTRLAPRLMAGKLLNAGQTCIAPDYALVPRADIEAFVTAIEAATTALYPAASRASDYTSIVSERHHARLQGLLEDAQHHGARIVPLFDGVPAHARQMPPTLVIGVDDRMAIMREEIFGPLLPVEAYDGLDDAIARLNGRPHPLALYWFGDDRRRLARVLRETRAGGVTVNDTLWHFAHEGLPFGGVGASGQGVYHGEHGFRTFTQDKPVFLQARASPGRMLHPPYGAAFERLLRVLKRL